MTEQGMAGAGDPGLVEVRAAMAGAAGGDPTALPRLRELLDATGLWRRLGDLSAHAELSWLAHVAGGDPTMREVLARKVVELKSELAGPSPSPLERLLVDRIAAAWLMVNQADLRAAGVEDGDARREGRAMRRQAQALRRYTAAITALATVRRLLAPVPPSPGVGRPGKCAGAAAPRKRRGRAGLGATPVPPGRGAVESGIAGGAKVALFEPDLGASGEGGG